MYYVLNTFGQCSAGWEEVTLVLSHVHRSDILRRYSGLFVARNVGAKVHVFISDQFEMEVRLKRTFFLFVMLLCSAVLAFGWGDEGHRLINKTAAAAISPDMPAFFKAGADKIIYNGPEPDRWREKVEPSLKNTQEPDHFIDFERVGDIGEFPRGRYDFIRWAYSKRLRTTDRSDDFLPERIGFQPYITAEVYERLKVAFRQYRALKAAGKATDAVENDALFYAGWLGHYVADGANPLHTTVNYNGWVLQPNPNGYTAEKIHSTVESDFINKNLAKVDPAGMVKSPSPIADPFRQYLEYLRASFAQVEPLYQIEKRGGFKDQGSDEARQFMRQRFAAGSQELLNLWYTAWVESEKPVPPYQPEVPTSTK
jgi:hypothetical protein